MRARSCLFASLLCSSVVAATAAAQVLPDGGAARAAAPGARPIAPHLELPTPPPPAPAASPASGLGKFTPTPVLSTPHGTAAEKQRWLVDQIDSALRDPVLAKAHVGVAVSEVDSGRQLYERNDTGLFNPASNVKLFTTAAALALLGPEYRWKTVIYADGPIVGGEVRGNLYLKGYGDPTLQVEDLWRLVSALWENGVRRVRGKLGVDDTFFDDVRDGPGFDQKQEDGPWRAPNGALSLQYNAIGVHVFAGIADAAPARIVLDPASAYFVVQNQTRTVATGRSTLTIDTGDDGHGHTLVTVGGRVRMYGPPQLAFRRVAHPSLFTAATFRALCERRGIHFGGDTERLPVPPGARALTAHYSQSLGIAVRQCNKHSNNFMAEQILKTLGAETGGLPGTWAKGLDAVAGFLERLGIVRPAYKMTNGSGLYDSNRFSPRQLVTLLSSVYRDFRFASDFVGSLGVAGADGTVGHRMEGSLAERYVRAKTGTLEGVSCLAGYAGAPGRAPLAFAIFMNGLPEFATAHARKLQDHIAEILVEYLLAT